MRSVLLLPFSILLAFTAPALSAARPLGLCRSIATMLRNGVGNISRQAPPTSLLETLAKNSHGRLVLAKWQGQGDQQAAYLRALGWGDESGTAVAALKADQLGLAMSVAGSASCIQNVVPFYRSRSHRLVPIVEPYVTRIISCGRWGESIILGSLDGKAFVAKDFGDGTDIAFSPWSGRAWDPVCSVLVRYVPKLVAEGGVCSSANCVGAEAEARRIAAKLKANDSYQQGLDPELDHLVDLANQMPKYTSIPVAPGWSGIGADGRTREYLAKVDGRPALALAAFWQGSPAGDSEVIGFAVGLWQEVDGKLAAVAGYHFRPAHSTIKSVSVTR